MRIVQLIIRRILALSLSFAMIACFIGVLFNRAVFVEIQDRRSEAQFAGVRAMIIRQYAYGDLVGLRSSLDSLATANGWSSGKFSDSKGETVWSYGSKKTPGNSARSAAGFLADWLPSSYLEKSLKIETNSAEDLGEVRANFPLDIQATQMAHLALAFFVPFLSFWLVFIGALYFALKKLTAPLDGLILDLREQAHDLNIELGNTHSKNEIEEILNLFRELRLRWKHSAALALKNEADAAKAKIAAQVAHDIRSPLAALDAVARSSTGLPTETRDLLSSAVSRISAITDDLLGKKKQSAVKQIKSENISEIVGGIVAEKQATHRNSGLRFQLSFDREIQTARIQRSEFERIVSNLINNSIEAFDGRACGAINTIQIIGGEEGSLFRLSIIDNGKGIASSLVGRLGERGLTVGKPNGSGLGLSHAKSTIESWGGTLHVSSLEGQWTNVSICLPKDLKSSNAFGLADVVPNLSEVFSSTTVL